MMIDEFASITKRVIKRDGFEGYLPTLCFPARKHVMVLEGVPDEKKSEIRRIALKWAAEKAQHGEEFLLAFKVDPQHFCVIRRHGQQDEEATFRADTDQGDAPDRR